MTTLTTAPLAPLLDRLFGEAEAPASPQLSAALGASPTQPPTSPGAGSDLPDYLRFYARAKDAYLAVSRETGRLLYMLVRATGARSIVEFGTSFGISTLHLAAGVRDNGGGAVITTEFEPSKVARARQNFVAAGLADLIELREGDALRLWPTIFPIRSTSCCSMAPRACTPASWNCSRRHFKPGTLIVADNADRSQEFLQRVRSSPADYISVQFTDDVELSMRTD